MDGAGSGAVTVDYSDGSPAVRLQADGGGVLYYPAEAEGGPPVIAVTIVAVNKYQTQVYIYEHPRDGRPGAGSALKSSGRRARRAVVRKGQPTGQLMLGSMNEHGVGFLQEHVLGSPGGSSSPSSPTGGRLLAAVRGVEDAAALVSTRSPPASPGSSRASSRQRSAQPRHSPSSATQAVGKSLSLTEKGGQVCEEGRVVAVWRWDGRGDAPPPLVTLQLNSSMRAEWRSRTDATLFFSAGGVQYEVPLGQQLRRTSTYLANSSPTLGEATGMSPSGGGTGRQVVSGGRLMHVTSPSLASRTAEIGAEASAKRMLLHPASSAVKHAGLAAVMAGLEDAFTPWKARAASHSRASREVGRRGGRRGATAPPGDSRSATAPRLASTAPRTSTASARVLSSTAADLRVAAREQTMMEAPRWLTQPTGAGRSTDGATPKATGDAAGLVAPSEAGVADPGASMQAALRSSGDGYGGVGGASWHGGRWLSAPATRSKLAQHHKPLPRSQALTRNSGRYDAAAAGTVPSRGPSGATVRERLQVVPCQQLDTWLAGQEAVGGAGALHPDALALVAVLREDDSACRKAARLVEGVNGTLAALYPLSPEFAGEREWEEDERALALAAAKVAGGGTHAPGLGPDGSLAPYRIVRVNAAEDAGWVKERGIRTLPYFMAYFKGALVYAGVLGGTGKVKVKPVGVAPNALLALRDPASQLACERLLKAQGVPSSLAPPSRFDVASGSMVGVADAAAARVEELRAAAAASQARLASAQAASSSRGLGGGAGTDATLASRAAFALAILESELPAEEATGVRKALGGGSGSPDAGGAPAAPVSNVRRDHLAGGETLVVSLLPRGSVPPGSVKWPTDPGLGGGPAGAFLGAGKDSGAAKTRRAGGLAAAQFHRRRGRRERLLARSASLAMSGPASGSQAVSSPVLDGPAPPQGQPWACPHTGIVQGATQTHLLHGVASIAVVSPMKPATLAALLRVYHSAWGHGGGSAGLLPGQDAGEAGTGDAPHLGLTHNDLLSRLAALKEAGEAGSSLPGDFLVSGGGIALSSSETVVRGVPLVKS